MEASRFETLRSWSEHSYVSHARLAQMECFRELDADFIDALTRELDIELFEEGDIIMKEGAAGSNMLFLVHGSVNILQGGQQIASLGAGSVIGELSCLGLSSKRTATVVATEFCDCRSIGARPLKALLIKFPEAQSSFVSQERVEQMERNFKSGERQARLDRSERRAAARQFGTLTQNQMEAIAQSGFEDATAKRKMTMSPPCSPPRKTGAAFRKERLLNSDSERRSEASADTSVPSTRACSADSSLTFASAISSDAPADRNPIFIASPVRQKALLPNVSPAWGDCIAHSGEPQTLRDAMRAKNDLLRMKLKKTAQQIDASRMCRGRTF